MQGTKMEYKKINELTAVVTGGTPSTRKNEYWDNGDIPWLQSGCCQNCDVDSTEKYITKEGYNNSSTHMMPADTVMIALTGATAGKVGYLKFEACGNQSITGILPCESLNQRYLFFYLLSQREKILADCVGGAQAHISQSYVKNMTIPILAIKEQEQIVGELTKLSNIVSLRQEEIQQLDALIKARFVEMFGDPIQNPKGWEVVTIGDIVTEVRYGTSKPAVEGGKYPYLRMNNLTADGHLDLNDLKYIDIPDDEIEKCVVRKGDVLFNRTNSIELVGKTAVFDLPEDMIIAGYIIRVRLTEKMLPEVLSQYMNLEALKGILRGMAKGAVNQANINAQELQSIKVYIPEMELQKQFVKMKEQIYKSKVAVQKALDETQILFDSLMQKYFG